MYEAEGCNTVQQRVEYTKLQRKCRTLAPLLTLQQELRAAQAKRISQRTQGWAEWCLNNWKTGKSQVYKYIKQTYNPDAMHHLHHGQVEAPTALDFRLQFAQKAWNQYWQQGDRTSS